ncbi:Spermidine/putrescine-binding periplasmic protein precursor [Pseudooceanicola marinus]|uniref:Spermidine/putrescine-binding periplasmic protein n=1 Tax=Pseudooceanicola marinus TaxID=396013 RepID=A0A1X6ZKP6_9RHOB|nr:extracellular solute-binding protein [Pseudooceanicola marinus]PJE31598.1 spermidine/putrescine ABC transporter substrate-binding protein [Pseudooceanicola marinus]SLN54375.1 Spermidine/putrescine-binding periplasmic protein precursor [Pseudooceanicola marinus]
MKKILLATTLILPLAAPAMADGSLNIYAWADSISPELIETFSEETGITVNVDSFSSNEDALTKLQAGSSGYDLVTPSQHFVKIMVDEGLLEDIDANEMAAYGQLDDRWTGQWWDPENDYSIPMAYGTAGFAVNRDLYDGPVDSWSVIFEPTDLAGSIAMLSYPDEVVSAAQLYTGVAYCSEDRAEMKKVFDLLMAQKPDVAAYTSDNIENRLGSGEVAAHFWWDGNVLRLRNSGANVEFAMPKEGLVGWLDSYVVPAGASNVDNAKAFIDFMSEVDNATAQYNYYAHSAPVEIDESKAKYTPENAPELFPTVPVVFARACSPAAQDLVTKVWTDLLQ